MNIAELRERSKEGLGRIPVDALLVLILALSCSASFGLGILVGREQGAGKGADDRLWIEKLDEAEPAAAALVPAEAPANVQTVAPAAAAQPAVAGLSVPTGKYVASKNGEKYYLPSCSGAKRIKEENKVWFATPEQAASAGYEPASNCPGL